MIVLILHIKPLVAEIIVVHTEFLAQISVLLFYLFWRRILGILLVITTRHHQRHHHHCEHQNAPKI